MPEATEQEEQEEPTPESPLDDPEWLEEKYHDDDLTQSEMATHEDVVDHHGKEVTASTVSHYMKKHEVPTRASIVDDERLEDPEWLANEYLSEEEGGEGEERTMQDIADEIGCSDGTVMRRLHEYDIDVRRSTVGESEDDAGE